MTKIVTKARQQKAHCRSNASYLSGAKKIAIVELLNKGNNYDFEKNTSVVACIILKNNNLENH